MKMKSGKKTNVGKEKKMKLSPVDAKLKKVSKALIAKHTAMNQAAQRAQLNG